MILEFWVVHIQGWFLIYMCVYIYINLSLFRSKSNNNNFILPFNLSLVPYRVIGYALFELYLSPSSPSCPHYLTLTTIAGLNQVNPNLTKSIPQSLSPVLSTGGSGTWYLCAQGERNTKENGSWDWKLKCHFLFLTT